MPEPWEGSEAFAAWPGVRAPFAMMTVSADPRRRNEFTSLDCSRKPLPMKTLRALCLLMSVLLVACGPGEISEGTGGGAATGGGNATGGGDATGGGAATGGGQATGGGGATGGGEATDGGCIPATCGSLGADCGSVGDGCGGTLSCGTCVQPATCGGGGVANRCGGGVSGPTYHVATNGDDARSCATAMNANTPKRTIKSGIACLAAGSTLLIAGGVYPEAINEYEVRIPSGTSWSAPVTISGTPGDRPILRPTSGSDVIRVMGPTGGTHHVIFKNLVLDGVNLTPVGACGIKMTYTGSDPANEAHHIRVQNCEIKNAPGQGILGCGAYSEILNNEVHHNGTSDFEHGIYCSSKGLLVDGNDFHHNSGWGIHIYKSGGTAGPNIIVRNNRSHDNARIGKRGPGIIAGGIGTLVHNNVVWNNEDGIQVTYSGANGVKVFNNTIYANRGYGIYVGNVPNAQLRNNIIFNNTGPAISNGGGTLGLIQSNNLTTDPLFVNAAGANFHIRAGSPAIDYGYNVFSAGVTADVDRHAYPMTGPYDVGAYQYR